MPDEFWSSRHTGLFSIQVLFFIAFVLLFILNLSFLFKGEKPNSFKESCVSWIIAIANSVIIVCVCLVLLNLVAVNNEYRKLHFYKVKSLDFRGQQCVQVQEFLGHWVIIDNESNDSIFKDYIQFDYLPTIKTNNPNMEIYRFNFSLLEDKQVLSGAEILTDFEVVSSQDSLKGILTIEYQFCDNRYCNWKERYWLFNKVNDEMVLLEVNKVKTESNFNWELGTQSLRLERRFKSN